MRKWAKNEAFWHFLDFGAQIQLDIAYFDSAKCFLQFSHQFTHVLLNWSCIISVNYAEMAQKRGFWSLSRVWSVCWTSNCLFWFHKLFLTIQLLNTLWHMSKKSYKARHNDNQMECFSLRICDLIVAFLKIFGKP